METVVEKRKKKDEITVLEGLHAVRVRPTMYIGSCGIEGLHHLFLEILHNSIDEHLAGTCTKIDVTLHEDYSITVSDNGRGIPVKLHSKLRISQLELALTKLHAGSKFFQKKGTRFSSGLNGVGASCVNALSTMMNVIVRREGTTYFQRYKEGVPVSPVRKANKAFPFKSGTSIHFKPDATIFETVKVDPQFVVDTLDDMAYLNPGVRIRFILEETDEFNGCSSTFEHKDGLSEYIKTLTEDLTCVRRDFFTLSKSGSTEDKHENRFDYKIEAAVQFVDDDECVLQSFVNNVNTSDGGTHLEGFLSGIGRAVVTYAKRTGKIRGIKQLKQSDATDSGIVSVLSFYMHEPRFASQTKKKLTNHEALKIVDVLTYDAFLEYLENNENSAKKIIARVIQNAKQRERIADIKSISKKENTSLCGKLADCMTSVFEDRELWIVEGDSAAGSMKLGRSARYQAILPLRGKIINAEKASIRDVSKNNEIMAIISAIGTGVCKGSANGFNLNGLRYNRIVISCDADVDGSHIRTLLLTFFYRFMKPLLENGHIYIACPPLYSITHRNKIIKYCMTDKNLNRTLAKAEARGLCIDKLEIQRYKGLGEMNPEQLWDTTMNPETRKLKRVVLNDEEKLEELLRVLMGTDTEARRIFIEQNALGATLDI